MERARLLATVGALLASARERDVPRSRAREGLARAVARVAATELARSRGMGPGLRRASLFREGAGEARWPGEDDLQRAPLQEAVRTLIRKGGERARPAGLLGSLHQLLLDHDLSPGPEGWSLVPWSGRRKRSGAFYTPSSLVEPTVARALGDTRSPRVCDPAMGTGVFLVAALDRLGGRPSAGEAATLRRVARRNLFGVDRDPLAVDLARVALWLEVGDPDWPADALDTQLRVGDSLLGAWASQAVHYPLAAWLPDRSRPSHREVLDRLIRPELARRLASDGGAWTDDGETGLRADSWCAAWFWPAARPDDAPTPARWGDPPAATRAAVEQVARRHRFLHWELAFPDVFAGPRPGFDAVVGNPPWEIRKPSSREFFSRVDPGFRRLGKQDAIVRQQELYAEHPGLEAAWREHLDTHRATSLFLRHSARPFGDPADGGAGVSLDRDPARSRALHGRWREHRGELPARPFRLQGSADLNCYKLFTEQALSLLRDGGRLGLLLPSGLYTDRGASELRRELLDRCDWEWLFSFDNRDGLFPIHRSYRFGPVIARKGGRTRAVKVAFHRRDPADWRAPHPPSLAYPRGLIRRLSPRSGALLELRDARDLAIHQALVEGGVPIGSEPGPPVDYHTGLHMTRDSGRFLRRELAEASGYRQERYGHWLLGPWRAAAGADDTGDLARSTDGAWVLPLDRVEDVALPLIQGVAVGALDGNAAVHVGGAGHRARWRGVGRPADPLGPQFLVRAAHLPAPRGRTGGMRVGVRSLSNATNERTVIATLLEDAPSGNSLGALRVGEGGWIDQAAAAAVLGSLCFDWSMRQRLAGTNVNAHFLWDSVWPVMDRERATLLAGLTLRLTHPGWRHAAPGRGGPPAQGPPGPPPPRGGGGPVRGGGGPPRIWAARPTARPTSCSR